MANLKVNRGTTFTIGFQYQKNSENHTLIGATVRFTVKTDEYDASVNDASALVIKNVTTGDSSGYADIILEPADTATIEPDKYYYDIKVEEAGGVIYKVDEGRFTLDGSPTNRMT